MKTLWLVFSLVVFPVVAGECYVIPSSHYGRVLEASVDVWIDCAEDVMKKGMLFFPAMQADLGPSNRGFDGGHIGLQYTRGKRATNWGGYFREFSSEGYRYTPFFDRGPSVTNEDARVSPGVRYHPDKNVSVGVAHFDPGTYTQVNTRYDYPWQTKRRYRYVVCRGEQKEGYWRWHGWVRNLDAPPPTQLAYYVGCLYSKASYIACIHTWVETSCRDKTKFDVRWSNPIARTAEESLDLTAGP